MIQKQSSTLVLLLLFFIVFSSVVALGVNAQADAPLEVAHQGDFEYTNENNRGPENWGDLKEEWATCKTGNMQSPVDLTNPRVSILVPKSEKIFWDYKPGNATLANRGHDIMVRWEDESSKIKINGSDYVLRQVHWHTPSEHTINGKRFAMELHMVHENLDPQAKNKIAVFGILYEIGKADPFLTKLEPKIKQISDTKDEVNLGIINPSEITRKGNLQYRYLGSLTTPPCTEGVIWTVNDRTSTVSREQIELLREAVDDGSMQNARPIQPLNDRKIRLYALLAPIQPTPTPAVGAGS